MGLAQSNTEVKTILCSGKFGTIDLDKIVHLNKLEYIQPFVVVNSEQLEIFNRNIKNVKCIIINNNIVDNLEQDMLKFVNSYQRNKCTGKVSYCCATKYKKRSFVRKETFVCTCIHGNSLFVPSLLKDTKFTKLNVKFVEDFNSIETKNLRYTINNIIGF